MKTALALLLVCLVQVQGVPKAPEGDSRLQQIPPPGPLAGGGGGGGLAREVREAGPKARNNRKNIKNSETGGKASNGNRRKNNNKKKIIMKGAKKNVGKGNKNSEKGGKARNRNRKRNKKNGGKARNKSGKGNKKNGGKGNKRKKQFKNIVKYRRNKVHTNRRKTASRKNANDKTPTNQTQCDLWLLYKLTRSFSVSRTQYNRIKRIINKVKQIQKSSSGSATNFEIIANTLSAATENGQTCAGSSPPPANVTDALNTLNNCSVTVPEICNVSLTDFTLYEANLTKCEPLLQKYSTDFKACFFGNSTSDSTFCTCLVAAGVNTTEKTLTEMGCLPNTLSALDKAVNKVAGRCKNGTFVGSNKYCKKTQTQAWEYIETCKVCGMTNMSTTSATPTTPTTTTTPTMTTTPAMTTVSCDLMDVTSVTSVIGNATEQSKVVEKVISQVETINNARNDSTGFQFIAKALSEATNNGTTCNGNIPEALIISDLNGLRGCSATIPTFCNLDDTNYTIYETNITMCQLLLSNFTAQTNKCLLELVNGIPKVCDCFTEAGLDVSMAELSSTGCLPDIFVDILVNIVNLDTKAKNCLDGNVSGTYQYCVDAEKRADGHITKCNVGASVMTTATTAIIATTTTTAATTTTVATATTATTVTTAAPAPG